MKFQLTLFHSVLAILACLLLSGCHVTQNNDGGKQNVNIGTPFGSLKVNTANTSDTSAIGMAIYPGAVPVKDGDGDGNSTNVNMNFGSIHFSFKTASFQTAASQDQVIAFYRSDLAARYGNVIECRDRKPIGAPTQTSQGLTCDTAKQDHAMYKVNSTANLELRAGSLQHEHLVDVASHNGGTEFGLIALDRPSHLSGHDSKDSE